MSKMYERAQQMLLADKFKRSKEDFFKDLASLVNAYLDCESLTAETIQGERLNLIITIAIKK